MQEKTRKLIMLISLIAAVLVAVLAIIFAMSNGGVKTLAEVKNGGLFDIAYWVLICFVGLSLLIWIYFGILSVIKKPKKALIFIAVIAIVVVASILLALGDTMPEEFLVRYDTSAGTAKLIAIACYITYFTVIGALVLMIYSAVTKSLKK